MPLPGISMVPLVPSPSFGGSLFAWGDSSNGHLGDGQTVTDFSSPIQIGASNWKTIASGGNGLSGGGHTLAIRADGLLFAWGDNGLGQLGDGTTVAKSSPIQIGGSSWIAVSCMGAGSLALRSDGLLFAWGAGGLGEIGDGSAVNRSSPVQIGASTWRRIATCQDTGFAIRSDGLLFAWGSNGNGEIGDGTITSKSSPVQIGASTWSELAGPGANNVNIAAIRSDGLLFMWGANNNGNIGDGTIVPKSSPVQIGSSSWASVSLGNGGTMAVRVDGLLFTWGAGTFGELGDGTIVSKSSPVQIGSSRWASVHATASRFAIDVEGRLFAWGGNGSGQLGDGTIVGKSSPVQIGASQWVRISGGSTATFNSFFTIGVKRL
jgi:alpha-tubulin suppressor-like RCC1 family protein